MKRLILCLTLLIALAAFILPQPAHAAFSLFGDACESGGETSAACTTQSENPNPTNPIAGNRSIINNIANLVALVGGVAGVIVIILGGIKMIGSGGSQEDIVSGRRMVFGAIIGLAIIALARSIIYFVMTRLS